jgi:hypothetical protein
MDYFSGNTDKKTGKAGSALPFRVISFFAKSIALQWIQTEDVMYHKCSMIIACKKG